MRRMLLIVGLAVFGMLAFTTCGFLFTDAATRLGYQMQSEAFALKRSGQTTRTFVHKPRAWPEGVKGDYRIELVSYPSDPKPDHRSIGVARNLTERTWYATSYHLRYVKVPRDLTVTHRAGEPTVVTLELRDGDVHVVKLE